MALALGLFGLSARADVQLAASKTESIPQGALGFVDVAFTGVADAPTVVVLHLNFDPARCTPFGGEIIGDKSGKSFDWNVLDDTLYVVAYSVDTPFNTANALRLYFKVALDAPEGAIAITQNGGSASNEAQDDLAVSFNGFTLPVATTTGFHTADTTPDWTISLSEVLRLVQFFNSQALHCLDGTEDGYAPGTGDQSCAPHDSDYFPFNWKIGLSEVLRLIQIYNYRFGSYHPDAVGEDGFVPGPF